MSASRVAQDKSPSRNSNIISASFVHWADVEWLWWGRKPPNALSPFEWFHEGNKITLRSIMFIKWIRFTLTRSHSLVLVAVDSKVAKTAEKQKNFLVENEQMNDSTLILAYFMLRIAHWSFSYAFFVSLDFAAAACVFDSIPKWVSGVIAINNCNIFIKNIFLFHCLPSHHPHLRRFLRSFPRKFSPKVRNPEEKMENLVWFLTSDGICLN